MALAPSVGHYRTFYPKATVKGKTFYLEYRQISRTFDLYHRDHNGKLIGKYPHSDFALLAVVGQLTGFKGDELPPKHKSLMKQIEKQFGIKYQGLMKDE